MQVDPRPQATAQGVNLRAVARIGWAAALCGATALAEACASRAAVAQELAPRAWADLTRAALALAEGCLPECAPPPGTKGAHADARPGLIPAVLRRFS